MELIIKPTGRCNFDCSFCSADGLDIAHPTHVPEPIKELIQKMKPDSIIVTGGEPMTIDPSYYLELKEIAQCHIGFTSNMKDFYLHPDKWKEIVQDPMFGFITSFNYGNSRKWDPHTVYTEEMFIDVFNRFYEVSGGQKLKFIAVIDEYNEDTIMDHVYLAKRLGTQVKINGALGEGRQHNTYPRYKIIKAYIDIIDAGLEAYEMTCSDRMLSRCPFNTEFMCGSTIRCCYVDSYGKLHYGICDDEISSGREIPMDTFPIQSIPKKPDMKDCISKKCMYCELYRVCNSCNAQRMLAIADQDPHYCEEMQKLIPDLIRVGWKL